MACQRQRVVPMSGRQHKRLKMTSLEARHGPARPGMRRWLASFLVDMILK